MMDLLAELSPPREPPLVGLGLSDGAEERIAARLVVGILGKMTHDLLAFSSFNGSWRIWGTLR